MPGIDACLEEAMTLPGALGAAIVDWTSGLALGTAGQSPNGDHEATAAETAELARAAAEYSAFAPPARPPTPAPASRPDGPVPATAPGPRPAPGTATGSAATPAPGSDGDKGPPVEDLIVTTRTGYHILSFVETTFDSSVFLHLWLDRRTGNLALARIRLGQLAERLVLG
ncbi:hypothetical protein [Streptomyces corynorhini]|uniref:Roadblock/LC7 domain-containing protein n=1 Tax=Streptomyces corynorhini TaxID=2282652 RepID=A0A370B4R2_9ACTN|nr:hypothetical protein [Streptomyces corynorhini]RDG36571.1 hypothetical protein DVH02_19285 [Streptomyces corynorhini]